ncbi:proline dehydrogenase family protein [[Eubacterium] cellulosolvens]
MNYKASRWVLPNLIAALDWCKHRNQQSICCTLDVLGENVSNSKQAQKAFESYTLCTEELDEHALDAAVAVKLSSLGAKFDKKLAREHLLNLYQATEEKNVNVELDMEGIPMVEYTLETAAECADDGYHVTLALQAYLDRTKNDIKTVLDHDITVRLVKGAYLGDTNDFIEIQDRFKNLTKILIKSDKHFTLGTHDPELIEWVRTHANDQKELIELGFLMGLGDETKQKLTQAGWAVSEYVPFGKDSKAYVTRRNRYLREHKRQGREPVP